MWRKSSFCNADSVTGNCVEVSPIGDGGALVRNTHRPNEVCAFTSQEWEAFLAGVKAGEFDDLTLPVTAEVDHEAPAPK
jgi:hypothetical protein